MEGNAYLQVCGSLVTLCLVFVSLSSCTTAMQKHLPTHPELQVLHDLGSRYNTTWNTNFLLIYVILSLFCDISAIKGKNVPQSLSNFRFKFFHTIVFPQVVSMIIFWPIYFYDRELVFPKIADIVISPFGNFVFHGLGIIYVTWELMFLSDDIPKRKDLSNKYLLWLHVAYGLVVLYTKYVDIGVWVYGILTVTDGTILFPFFFFSVFTLANILFYCQWYIKDFIWNILNKHVLLINKTCE